MNNRHEPKIVGFLCNWCSYTGADLAGTARMKIPPTIKVIRVMCSGRIDPLFVLRAYLKGADGVMLMGCHPGDCHYQKGNYNTRRRFVMMQTIFNTLGLEKERIGLWWVSASEAKKYSQVTTEFSDKITKMGPNPFDGEVFL
ncbi:MAG: hydrogenase iron-sulfur subunit [Candidatus Aminicenantaceae bacterium]